VTLLFPTGLEMSIVQTLVDFFFLQLDRKIFRCIPSTRLKFAFTGRLMAIAPMARIGATLHMVMKIFYSPTTHAFLSHTESATHPQAPAAEWLNPPNHVLV
jgi:hypothetical protein